MPLADGPAMFFGGSIMSFALPYGAFIVCAVVLYFLFRAKHTGPKLKYLTTAFVTSVATREPGPVPAPPVTTTEQEATAEPEPAEPEAKAEPEAEAEPESKAEPESEKQ